MSTAPRADAAAPVAFKPRLLPVALGVALTLYLAAGALPFDGESYPAQMAAAITGFVAVCWLTNLVPLGAASLMPLALMPMLGVLPIGDTSSSYAHPVIWMFFGGFVLALGIERWGLHRRVALNIVVRVGAAPGRLVFGFAIAAGALSMWLNNTAMTLLLLPIATALIESMEKAKGVTGENAKNFAFALLVAIAYSCSIGGMGTPIGTAPNAIMLSNYAMFEDAGAPPLTFAVWMASATPLVIVMIPLTWFLLTRVLTPVRGENPEAQSILKREAEALPQMSVPEFRMALVFVAAALAWTFRRDIDLGELGTLPGWWRLFPVKDAGFMGDAAVAASVCVGSFLIPAGPGHRGGLMNWETTRRLPWEILFLIGGGIAIATSFTNTGLAVALGKSIQPLLSAVPAVGMVALVCLAMTFFTEVTSNTAMTALMLPVLGGAALALEVDPRLLMLPATFAASCAFMLPIATPPNAIVFSSGRVEMARMARVGLVINLVGVMLISGAVWVFMVPALGIDTTEYPEWARTANLQPSGERSDSANTPAPPAKTLRVGVTGDNAPFALWEAEEEQPRGDDVNRAQRFADAHGVAIQWVRTDWRRILDDLSASRFDVAWTGVAITQARTRVARFSRPYLRGGRHVVVRCEDRARITLETLPRQRFVVTPRDSREAFLLRQFPSADVTVEAHPPAVFDRLVQGDADVVIADSMEAKNQVDQRAELCIGLGGAMLTPFELAVLAPKDSQWLPFIDRWLANR